MALAADAVSAASYNEKMLRYKFLCLRIAKKAVASDEFSSDATVALTLVLASEAVRTLSALL
jgi:hypothetical protein